MIAEMPLLPQDPCDDCVQARVLAAPAIGGEKMYEVILSCQGKFTTMYKSRQDFRNVINMLKLVGAMAKSRGNQCQVCRECAPVSMMKLRCVDEDNLHEFLSKLLSKLRDCSAPSIESCGAHRGVIQVVKDFLSVRNCKYFCANRPTQEDPVESAADPSSSSAGAFHESGNSRDVCSLHRVLSQKFATFDSVC